ncbi:MAG TPA: cytochrome c, partial [Rubrivivax sp.]|nr:cytochrome c [Rubrivivax sp.]
MPRLILAAVIGLATALPAAAQFQKPDDAVKYRKAAFTVMAAHFGRIGGMVQGRAPFDGDAAAANAAIVAQMSTLPFAGFVEG